MCPKSQLRRLLFFCCLVLLFFFLINFCSSVLKFACFLRSLRQLSLEKKKELQQDKQKALELEVWKQNSRKRALLTRVQEILENVQVVLVQSLLTALQKTAADRRFEKVLVFKHSPI